ncbi:MAG: hypothetical protein Q9184_005192 [Pyrenodesmia sp. 2 TL-2023]
MSTLDETIEMTARSELERKGFSEELEAETGFSCYEDYAEASGREHGSDRLALISMGYLREGTGVYAPSHCCVMDVSKENPARELNVRLNLSSSSEADWPEGSNRDIRGSERATALELLKGLKSPVKDGSVRVVTWFTQARNLISEWVDIIGIGLQVPSSFFTAVTHKFGSPYKFPNAHDARDRVVYSLANRFAYPAANRFAYPQHLVIGSAVATLLHNNGSDAPIILIAYSLDPTMFSRGQKISKLLELDAEQNLPFAFPNVNRLWESRTLCKDLSAHYQRLLRANLEQDASSNLSGQDPFYLSLLPLFVIASMSVQVMHGDVEWSLFMLHDKNDHRNLRLGNEASIRSRNETYNDLDQKRYQLRRAVEENENDQQFFLDYVVSNGNKDWLDRRAYRTTAAYSELTSKVAKRLEAEVRDYMQLVVGVLSIEESKKSIHLTSTQLDEGKKVTILAFIYVPLNLATSIFGMNLQQLNAEGQPVWVFVLTALLATILTAFIWFFIDQINSIRRWTRMRGTLANIYKVEYEGIPDYSIGVRITMIYLIMHWGYTKWMFRSGG